MSESINYVPGPDLLSDLKNNPCKRWHHYSGPDQGSASERISAGGKGVRMQVRPRFKLKKSDRIFTIGSCFARNVEEVLVGNGFDVPTFELEIPREYYNNDVRKNAVLNRYTPHSILSEVEKTCEDDKLGDEEFIHFNNNNYIYSQAALTKPNTIDNLNYLKTKISETNREIFGCNIVFITLGLTESWVDGKTGLVLNSAPPPRLILRERDRFQFFNASASASLSAMKRLINLIADKINGQMKFIVTVSPVPLQATFSGHDVIQANTYSKSVLRTVADELYQAFDHVDYFPSFEMVMNSAPEFAWMQDRLHVRGVMVEKIMKLFQDAYFE